MSGRDVFPYPPDDPATIRALGRALGTLHKALDRSERRIEAQVNPVTERWLGAAGPRAAEEVASISSAVSMSRYHLEGLEPAATAYALVLEGARQAIDHIRPRYDEIDRSYDGTRRSNPMGPLLVAVEQAFDGQLRSLHTQYQHALANVADAGKRFGAKLTHAAGAWSAAPASANPGLARLATLDRLRFMVPLSSDLTITRTGDLVIVDTGRGDDHVVASVDPVTGELVVVINGVEHRFPASDAKGLVIRTGLGNDVIEVPSGTPLGFTLLGEDGNDTIDGGAGNDLISGGFGDDQVTGGMGDDTVALGAGNDRYRDGTNPRGLLQWLGLAPIAGGRDVVAGGMGDDEIETGDGDDHIDGGDGNDRIDAGRGDDDVYGGYGDDRIYAGDGNDRVHGGPAAEDPGRQVSDNDWIDGGRGNDRLDGGDGNDTVSGGQGDDLVQGGAGNDVLYAGAGHDHLVDTLGRNTMYTKGGDAITATASTTRFTVQIAAIPGNIRIEGSPAFVDRAQADLDFLASSPTGQQMLARMNGVSPRQLLVRELTPEQATTAAGLTWGEGQNTVVAYNPHGYGVDVLYHEMSHADAGFHNAVVPGLYHGTDARDMPKGLDLTHDGRITRAELDRNHDGRIDQSDLDLNHDGKVDTDDGWTPNMERQATGAPVDPDGDPGTPDVRASTVVDQPDALSENDLRAEMGLPPVPYHW